MAQFKRKSIRNCVFGFQYDKSWSALYPTKVDGEKFCPHCQEVVHFCASDKDLANAIKMNWCVAIEDASIKRRNMPPSILVGTQLG